MGGVGKVRKQAPVLLRFGFISPQSSSQTNRGIDGGMAQQDLPVPLKVLREVGRVIDAAGIARAPVHRP